MAVSTETVIAANRFGLGARPGDLAEIGDAPREWLLSQVQAPKTLLKSVGEISTSKEAILMQLEYRRKTREAIQAGTPAANANNVQMMAQSMRPLFEQHLAARMTQALESEAAFYERLVHFWSNHFAVSITNVQAQGSIATLEFEAIRPNITGQFVDLLQAVEQHPVMLAYLDNVQSIGPNSRIGSLSGRRNQNRNADLPPRKVDINENLAREILELHTLGVDGGYTQEDVTTFAKVITGWGIGDGNNPRFNRSEPGEFYFNDNAHEPGSQTLLGKTYKQGGIKQGEAVLADLAQHPSTARHLATKLARHFIADNPPAAAVDRISKAYLDSDGNLPTVYQALISSTEAWEEPLAKYKSPNDFILSMYRAIDYAPRRAQQVAGPFAMLGQNPFRSGSPAGWPDTAKDWSGGEALFKRVEMAVTTGNNVGNRYDPVTLADAIMGPVLSEHTRTAISRAESGAQGIALLFSSSEFMRR